MLVRIPTAIPGRAIVSGYGKMAVKQDDPSLSCHSLQLFLQRSTHSCIAFELKLLLCGAVWRFSADVVTLRGAKKLKPDAGIGIRP